MSKQITKEVTSNNLFNYLQTQIFNFGIDQEKREALCFRERLDVYSKNISSAKDTGLIGDYFICVESTGSKNQNFLIYVFSSMKIDGSLGGSKIISSATEELQCLEEKRNEFIEINKDLLEKNLYISSGDIAYSVKTTNDFIINDNKSFDINYDDLLRVISDGCNILLMRYLAITDFDGSLTFDFITIDGKVVMCNYECSSAKLMEIDDNNLDAYMIKQSFYENGNNIQENKILMTKKGKIIRFEWTNLFHVMKINYSSDLLTCTQDSIILPLRETWHEDIELKSKYKDKKSNEMAKLEQYLFLHTEVRTVMADYIQTLLCRKPQDALQFTLNYFKTLVYNSSPD